ncbi:hypothetical protein URH17368_2194 [Alicyclobacillus hesperidum URH17-3-68]|uniref:Membrane protein YkvI n=1 Tax=Alicyclobacillus hesperidum TaxID=89784 RepID=A0A1H2WQZ8_9BACL|nr:hypothetical protein [Alicyclobacillus hesperidum]EJY55039.1 hypothetical protein URH17368_2194 [Alicyclobacillus hesperidum URH17-3-68]GLV12590.1 putative membrane protein YkvI [Alicyclobacillus hesperidum]SDW83052.1 Uncharacterized membrane protein YkvI [Alicyclobacillus hesperidum]
MRSRWLTLQVACVYIGTVVGAGFASGREIYQFFAQYGMVAYASIGLVTLVFAWLGYRLMALGAKLGAKSFRDLTTYVFPPRLAQAMDGVVLVMLFGTTVAMLAGTGELFRERLGLPFSLGVVIGIAVTMWTMMFGMNGLLKVNTLIVPSLTAFVLFVTAHTALFRNGFEHAFHPLGITNQFGLPVWLNALLYASLNIGLSIGVLVPLGGQIRSRKVLSQGALLGALGLGGLLACVAFSLFAYMPQIGEYAIPMGYIAAQFPRWLTALFIAVLFGEIYSTLVGNIYSMAATVARSRRHVLLASLIALVAAGLLSHFGFRAIVAYAYTAFGWVSLWFLSMLVMARARLR